jgi:single-strand DNA-binding protein
MNKVLLTGNVVRDPEHRATKDGTSVCNFTIAINRKYKDSTGTYPSDYINCVAWKNTADFVSKYFQKGSPIEVEGNLQTRNFEDSKGIKRYVTEVYVEQVGFNGRRLREDVPENKTAEELFGDELAEFKPIDDADLPF